MCDPATVVFGSVTLGQVATAASIGGTILQAAGAMKASDAAADMSRYRAGVARNNQIIADRKAVDIERRGELASAQKRAQIKQLGGRQLVSLAAQGVDVSEGTSIDLLAEAAELGELDAAAIRTEAARDASAMRAQGMQFQTQADLFQTQAEAESPLLAGATTALTGFGQVASQWYRGNTVGNA